MPQVTVISQKGKKSRTVFVKREETVLDALRKLGILMENCCGNGSCGKCAVFYESPAPESCLEDEVLGEKQLMAGGRLACCHTVEEDIRVRLTRGMYLPDENIPKMQIEGIKAQGNLPQQESGTAQEYTVILDIGTTTLAAAFVRESDFQIERVLTGENSQRRFGSDVISRIEAACKGHGADLKDAIWSDIQSLCVEFEKGKRLKPGESIIWKQLVISANTVMEHLLLGYSCKGLGEAPFQPVSLELTEKIKKEIAPGKSSFENVQVTVLPGISAFVGADIVSGLFAVSMDKEEGAVLFADIGTNGEMALGKNGRIFATAASAGPAFEGANIRDGVPGIEGAICQANLLGGRLVANTIGEKPPIGICGTGVLELASELYRGGIVDGHGTFCGGKSDYPVAKRVDGSEICFTQEDMRQLQMAKSAIRSGMELLLKRADVQEENIKKIYLAGGFGCRIHVHKAAILGLIPGKLEKRAEAVGNTSLLGAYQYTKACRQGKGAEVKKRLMQIATETEVLNLAEQPEFEEYYIRNMDF